MMDTTVLDRETALMNKTTKGGRLTGRWESRLLAENDLLLQMIRRLVSICTPVCRPNLRSLMLLGLRKMVR